LLNCAEYRLPGNSLGDAWGRMRGSKTSQLLNGRLLKGAIAKSTDIPRSNHPARLQLGLIGTLGASTNTAGQDSGGEDTAGEDRSQNRSRNPSREKPLQKIGFS
jgi:hypothetical protein